LRYEADLLLHFLVVLLCKSANFSESHFDKKSMKHSLKKKDLNQYNIYFRIDLAAIFFFEIMNPVSYTWYKMPLRKCNFTSSKSEYLAVSSLKKEKNKDDSIAICIICNRSNL